ncbi:uncharacterized protein [Anabrus simplex]|uniref:uncharacterized protein n=1 Tax=Anabrus simplex TaxID=316456 RepID=UPI0035A293FF
MASSVPEWIDRDFCERLVERIQEGSELISWVAEPLAVSGDNYSSILYRVSLRTSTNTFSLVVKSLPQGSMMREYMLSDGIFSKEVELYQKVFPAMYSFYVDHGGNISYFCPQSYPSPISDTVVLQDLQPLGYTLRSRQEQFNMDHSAFAMKTLALFHGLSVGLHSRNSKLVECYKENIYTTRKKEVMRDYTNLMLMDLASEVETWIGFERFGNKIRDYSKTVLDTWINIYEQVDGFFLVLNHGDFWTSNMLFRYSDSGKIEDLKLIDFQYSKYAPAVLDILYLLYSSVQESVRKECIDELLGEYLAVLRETLDIVGCSERLPSLKRLKKEMRDKMDLVAMVALTILPAMVANEEEMANFGTLADEASSLGGVQNPIQKSIKGNRFRQILPSILIDLERDGIL